MEREKILLNSSRAKISVNVDNYSKVSLVGDIKELPVGDINNIVNVADRFNYERQNSKLYRLTGTINSLFTNSLFNVTGTDSWSTFMSNLFRDRSYPPNNQTLDEEDYTYLESIEKHLTEDNGWYGYFDPNVTSINSCTFYDMQPSRDKFLFAQKGGKNWDMTITYPYKSVTGFLTDGGLFIVDKKEVSISGRKMTAFAIPVKHNLTQGNTVVLSGMNPINLNGEYKVIRNGLDNGDLKDHYFCLDLDPTTFTLGLNPRFKKVINGSESEYYYRKFKKIKMKTTPEMEDDDYEIYPLAFSQNIYNDKISQFVINEDIDISELVDNLGRPLSELFITFIKTSTNGVFGKVKSGFDMPFISEIENFKSIQDIRRISSDLVATHSALNSDVKFTNNDYFGDIVEYNAYELIETVLSEVNHRFNTVNREMGGLVVDPADNSTLDLGVRHEGMIYKPHHRIKIRDFSSYIEQGDTSVIGIPDYAEDLGDGRFLWRDLLDIGFNDIKDSVLEYPFLNGSHYINKNLVFALKRQDPFGKYGLYYNSFPRDSIGRLNNNDNLIVKKADDTC